MKRPIRRWAGSAAAALGLLFACAKAPPAPVRDTLVRHLDGNPATLDPITTNDEFGLRVVEMIFRPLLGIGRDRRIVPGLARSWQVSTDGRVYTFSLDPDAKWEDGSPVTSADVKFTLEKVVDPKARAVNWLAALEDLESVQAPDAATAKVTFRKPYAERLLAFNLPVVSAAAYRRAPEAADRSPVGSGPYRLESWETNQKIVLSRRADAPKSEAAYSRVVFRILPEPAVTFQAGSRGELDEFRITRDQRATAEKTPEFLAKNRILKVPLFVEVLVIWNFRNPFLADARVRRALALSWPRAETARRLYPPDGATLVSGPYPPGALENDTDVQPPFHDPEAAGRLLDQAGFARGPDGIRRKGGRKASIELLFAAGNAMNANLAEILRQAYAKVGVELTLRPMDWSAFAQRGAAGEFDAWLGGRFFLPPNVDPYPYFHSSQAPPKGSNAGFYSNREADRVMEAAERELDDAKRLALYKEIHRLLAGDPPADFLWGTEQYWAVSRSIAGVEISPLGLFHFLPGPLAWRPAVSLGP